LRSQQQAGPTLSVSCIDAADTAMLRARVCISPGRSMVIDVTAPKFFIGFFLCGRAMSISVATRRYAHALRGVRQRCAGRRCAFGSVAAPRHASESLLCRPA